MHTNRLEAFSDGVMAIIITIMVLEFSPPQQANLSALRALDAVFVSYVLSFIMVGIYWNNHHHLFQVSHIVNGRVLWANLHLLFWLSTFPFTSAWMGETDFAQTPVALYGIDLLGAGVAYWLLVRALISANGRESAIAVAIGSDRKGVLSVLGYLLALPLTFVSAGVAFGLYALVAALWLVPDNRIAKVMGELPDVH